MKTMPASEPARRLLWIEIPRAASHAVRDHMALPLRLHKPNNSLNRLVWARLTGISLCFLSSMRSW